MSELVKTARRYLGVPFRHRGRNPAVGLDCAGFPRQVYLDRGVELKDVAKYPRESNSDRIVLAACEALGEPVAVAPVRRDQLQVGDLCVQRFNVYPHHFFFVGDYYLGGLSCLHADGDQGPYSRVVEVRLDDARIALITHVFRKPV